MSVQRKSQSQPTIGSQNLKHLLDVDSMSLPLIRDLFQSTEQMKKMIESRLDNQPLLKGRTIVTIFFENSTRTRVSFEQAGKILGADVINLNISSSSVSKGESILNTVRTIQSMGIDCLVIRHNHSGVPYFMARNLDVPVINAGDGWHAHPTQTLLDVFTIQNEVGEISGKQILIVGDIKHSRVARSNISTFLRLGAKVTVVCPRTLLPDSWIATKEIFQGVFTGLKIRENIEEELPKSDIVMTLRIQNERQQQGYLPSLDEYSRVWGLSHDRFNKLSPHAFVMHPGPVNEGIEISSELMRNKNVLIEKQVANGVAVRMAILHKFATLGILI